MSLAKAEEFLQAAQWGLDEGWCRHGGLQATFSTELVQRRKVYPASFVRDFAEAMEWRHSADSEDSQVSLRQATQVVSTAAEFVSRVQEVIGNV